MKKSVLTTSLIAASVLFTGTVFAGNYVADSGYTSADTAPVTSGETLEQGWYVGVGANRTAQNNVQQENIDYSADTQKVGFGLLVGKHLSDVFALEVGYNAYGTNTFTAGHDVTGYDYYGLHSITALGVINSPELSGFSAHVKAGAAYFAENWKQEYTGAYGKYSGSNLAYGFGVEYLFGKFGVSLDWTRIDISEGNSTTENDFDNVYAPDQFSLNLVYNFA